MKIFTCYNLYSNSNIDRGEELKRGNNIRIDISFDNSCPLICFMKLGSVCIEWAFINYVFKRTRQSKCHFYLWCVRFKVVLERRHCNFFPGLELF